jgi:hypothetical protein
MKKHIHLLLLALVIATIALIQPNRIAHACTCVPLETSKKELAKSDFVFQGRVTTIIPIGISSYSVSFDVVNIWKGVEYRSVTLKEVYCPMYPTPSRMTIGKEYIIYANGDAPNFTFGLCTRTVDSQDINDEIKELGPGKYPAVDYPIHLRQDYLLYCFLLIAIMLAIVIPIAIIRRKNVGKNKT